jgi:hypothetical protein
MFQLPHRPPPGIDLPLPGAIADRVEWRMTDRHLLVRGVRSPYDRLADPDCRRLEWFEHRLPIRVALAGASVRLIDTPGGPHLLVEPAPRHAPVR